MDEEPDQAIEKAIREGWAAQGLAPADLPPSHDPRMKGLIAIMRQGRRRAEAEILRLEGLVDEVQLQLAELETRVRKLEARVGMGHTLQ